MRSSYSPIRGNSIRRRKLQLKIGSASGSEVEEFDESFRVLCRVSKNVLEVQNTATITITNLMPSRRNELLKYFTQWDARNRTNPFIPIELTVGREGAGRGAWGFTLIFRGAIVETGLGEAPDLDVTMKCSTSLIDMNIASTGFLTNTLARNISHRELCQWAANLANLELQYEVRQAIPTISSSVHANVIQRAYSLNAIVGMLANFAKDRVAVFVDDGVLIVTEWGNALRGEVVPVNIETSLLGIPSITQWGVKFTTLADTKIRLAGGVALRSELAPHVNQNWVVTGVEYDIDSRGNNWNANWSASPSA